MAAKLSSASLDDVDIESLIDENHADLLEGLPEEASS